MCSSTNFHLEKESSMGDYLTQGIVSILRSDCKSSSASPAAKSLRRTLSADMSSKKWLAQNGFTYSPMKRIASSEELLAIGAGGEDELPGQDEVWRSIQAQKKADGEAQSWGSILSEKNDSKLQPPYTPPLLRTSGSSCLSEKSLEICTESLGSETGSDGYSPSEEGDVCDHDENHLQLVKYKKMEPASRAFPPPLPSLLAGEDGASLQMQPHRQNGRLVLEAVSVASQTYFQAHREHGSLRLSLLNEPTSDDDDDDDVFDGEFEESSCIDEGEYSEIEMEANMGGGGGNGIIAPIMVKKVMGLDKKNLVCSSGLNKGRLNLLEIEDDASIPLPLPHSLPPLISFNAYEYFWREKKPAAGIIKPNNQVHQSPPLKNTGHAHNQHQNLVFMRGNKPELVPSLRRSCNESRRTSLLLWEPFCIVT